MGQGAGTMTLVRSRRGFGGEPAAAQELVSHTEVGVFSGASLQTVAVVSSLRATPGSNDWPREKEGWTSWMSGDLCGQIECLRLRATGMRGSSFLLSSSRCDASNHPMANREGARSCWQTPFDGSQVELKCQLPPSYALAENSFHLTSDSFLPMADESYGCPIILLELTKPTRTTTIFPRPHAQRWSAAVGFRLLDNFLPRPA